MRVVVVDPSRTVLKFIERLLATRNHEVRTFVGAREALECVRCDPSVGALITSDELVPMSEMSGIELCWEARLLATCRRPIYIILMSCDRDQHKLIEALDSGADDFIGKPPVAEELYARLRSAERLASMQQELLRLALTDPLTGVLNRRAFFERAEETCERAHALDALSAIVMDIDHFKRINDVYGHDVGDETIRRVAEDVAAERAITGRLGGEEFAMVLEGRDLAAALRIAEALRSRMAAMRVQTERQRLKLTCSFGVSEWEPGDTVDRLLKRADLALYAAKSAGRNRVVAFDPELIAAVNCRSLYGRIRSAARSLPQPA
jgi:two-component system, cell cycle response regulator